MHGDARFLAVEGAGAVFIVEFAACAPDVTDEFLGIEQTTANIHETHLYHGVVFDEAVGAGEGQRIFKGQGQFDIFSEQVSTIENRAGTHQQWQTTHVTIPRYGINCGGEEIVEFFPFTQIGVHVGQQIAKGGGIFRPQIHDVRAIAGGDPTRDRGVEVAPTARQDFHVDAGMFGFKGGEGHIGEPGHRIFSQAGDVNLKGHIVLGSGGDSQHQHHH